MQTGQPCNELTERINTAVLEARKREEWRSDYMRMSLFEMDTRDAVREEEREKTERERKRADMAEERAYMAEERAESEKNRADIAEARVRELEALLYSVKT